MSYKITVYKDEDFRTSEWSGGTTTEMLIYPEGSVYKDKDFSWRISSATVELDESDFTPLLGVNRFITTLNGKLKLTHDYKEYIELESFEIYEFSGGIDTHSYGRVKDFNLMIANRGRGVLKSESIKGAFEYNFKNEHENPAFEVFYSYEGSFIFHIEDKEFNLDSNQLMIIELEANSEIKVEVKSKEEAYILHASLFED